ncbi:hypothetical protein MDAP_001409 [Mitosporidium daphniae]
MNKHFRVFVPSTSKFDIESQGSSSIFFTSKSPLSSFERYALSAILFFLSFFSVIYALFHLPFAALSPRSFLLPLDISELLILSGIAVFSGFKRFQKMFFSKTNCLVISLFNSLLLCLSFYSSFVHGTYLSSLLLAVLQSIGLFLWIACAVPGGLSGVWSACKAFLKSILFFLKVNN